MTRLGKLPNSRGRLSFLTLVLVFCSCVELSQTRHFQLKRDGEDYACIMVDVDFDIRIRAMKDGKIKDMANLSSENEDIKVEGECDTYDERTLGIIFDDSTKFFFAFQPSYDYPVAMFRGLQFLPQQVFGDDVNVTKEQGFSDPRPIYLNNSRHSYKCDAMDSEDYITYTNSTDNFSFTVEVNVFRIKAQGYGIVKSKFGESETCDNEPKPIPTRSTTTEAPPAPIHPTKKMPTVAPFPNNKPSVNTYIVKAGNKICIALESAIEVIINYQLKGGKNKSKKVSFNIPETATATGNCSESDNTQALKINFFDDWSLDFIFEKDSKVNTLKQTAIGGEKDMSYRISQMALTVVVDKERFPDSMLAPGSKYTVGSTKSKNFPQKSSGSSFYRCDSNTTYSLLPNNNNVQVRTEHLKFKAFNNDDNAKFEGDEAVCSADDDNDGLSDGAIAGIVIGVLLVVVIVFLLVVLIVRRKRSHYEIL